MGTRGLIGFILPEGTVHGAYNQYDMYPSGVGSDIQKELENVTALIELLPLARAVEWKDMHEKPTPAELIAVIEKGIVPDGTVSTGTDWYSVLRSHQGSLRQRLDAGIACGSAGFLKQSLFCEWSYLIDFRSEPAEMVILKGFNTDPSRQALYCTVTREELREVAATAISEKYFGCYEIWRGSLEAFKVLDLRKVDDEDEAIAAA